MGRDAPRTVLLTTLVLVVASVGAFIVSGLRSARRLTDPAHHELGLPGLGRATDLSRCAAAFDPRLAAQCALRHGDLPGTDVICPDHALGAVDR